MIVRQVSPDRPESLGEEIANSISHGAGPPPTIDLNRREI
jgi:hypothetical protein